jgi:hypothetical protein
VTKRKQTREQRMKQRLEDKLDRLRSDLPLEKRPVKRRPDIHPNDIPRWDYRR